MRPLFLRRRDDRGFAMITALWLTIIGVMLVTTISSMLMGRMASGTAAAAETRARYGALSFINQIIADFIADRPTTISDTSGVMLTEILNNPYLGPTVSLNGVYVSGASDQVALYNWGPKPIDISGWTVRGYNNGSSSWISAATAVPASTTLQPSTALWITADVVVNTGDNTIFFYGSDGITIVDSARITTAAAGNKIVCLPDGANQGGVHGSAQTNTNSNNPNVNQTYYWIKAPFQHVAAGLPGASDTNGAGRWMDDHAIQKWRGTTLDTTYVFPAGQAFLRFGKSLVIRNDSAGWSFGNVGETVINVPGFPAIDHTAANSDSIAFVLVKSGVTTSMSGSLNDSVAPQRWIRNSTTDPSANLAFSGAAATPGTPDASYTITTPFISEISDIVDGVHTTPLISKVAVGVYGGTPANREIVEIYNPSSNDWDLGVHPLRLYFTDTVFATLNLPHIIPAYGFYLWTDSRPPFASYTGVDSDHGTHPGYDATNLGLSGEVGLYHAISGNYYDTGYGPGGNTQTSERKAHGGATAASMQVGGADVDKGNIYKGTGTAADFVTHAATSGATVQWRNRFSPVETPVISVIGADEFIEISLGPAPSAADLERRLEFIEIQNMTSGAINLQTADYWISVGSNAAGNKRRLSALFGGSASLDPAEVGVVIAIDADTATIATHSGMSTSNIKWFGLGAASGTPTDTMLGVNGTRAIHDTADYVVVGYGNAQPGVVPFWFGVPLPNVDSGIAVADTSWQKILVSIHDDTTSTFTTWQSSNWRQVTPTPGIGLSASGRSGYDGAGDSWYAYNYDNYRLLYSAKGYDIYGRARVMDEAGKINVNMISSSGAAIETGVFTQLFQKAPNPPFSTSTVFTAANAIGLYKGLIAEWTAVKLVTPLSLYNIYQAANTAGYRNIDSSYVPFLTVYGYNEAQAFPININTAETPVLEAVFVQLLANSSTDSGYPSQTLANARIRARSVAHKVYTHLTNHDGGADSGVTDDTGFPSLDVAYTKIAGLMTDAQDTAAVDWAWGDGRFPTLLSTSSNGYFMIYSTCFIFKGGADPTTDTPITTARIVAVAHRSSAAPTAKILYWREIFDLMPNTRAFTWPIGTARYPLFGTPRDPIFGWDPVQ